MQDVSEKLQLNPKLTLEMAINLVPLSETVKQQQSIPVGGLQSKSVEADSIAKGKPHRMKQGKIRPSTTPQSKSQLKSPRCLESLHPKKTCPAGSSKSNKFS